jgi:ribosomal protein S18 acetylase RimI-like enzyme
MTTDSDVDAAIRIATAGPDFADWPALLDLLQRAFAGMDGRIDPPSSLAAMDAQLLQAKARAEQLILACDVADECTRLAGSLFAALRPGSVYFGKLAVDPAWRGRGLARRLVDCAAHIARTHGRPCLELQTRVELVENQRAFAALGFVEVGRSAHPGYARPTSITMRRSL